MDSYEGTIFQRGSKGQVPDRQAINGVANAFGNIPLSGPQHEHVTMSGDGWHRSWDNPGPVADHSKDHRTGERTQHPH